MNRTRSRLALVAVLIATAGLGAALVPTASALPSAPPAPAWQAIAAMAEDAAQRSSYDAALAWMAARGPVRDPITEADDVAAMLSLAQAWAARGDQRIERGEEDEGLADLSEVLRHGAAVERHAHTLSARRAGARIQRLTLELLAAAPVEALSGAQRAELLMVLGESAVLPSPAETLQRQCALDAAKLLDAHPHTGLLSAERWLTDPDESAQWLQRACAEPSTAALGGGLWNRRGAEIVTERASANRAEAEAVGALVDENARAREALRARLTGGMRDR